LSLQKEKSNGLQSDWPALVSKMQEIYNNKIHSITKFSPKYSYYNLFCNKRLSLGNSQSEIDQQSALCEWLKDKISENIKKKKQFKKQEKS